MTQQKQPNNSEDEGDGGKTGDIEFTFHNTLADQPRDDQLPEDEKKRLLNTHQSLHQQQVLKQKQLRDQYIALKEGRIPKIQSAMRGNNLSNYKKHFLSNKAQFSGVEKQTQPLPSENEAETNPEQRQELQLQNRLQLQNEYTHKYRPQLKRY